MAIDNLGSIMRLHVSEAALASGFWENLNGSALDQEAERVAESILSLSNIAAQNFPGATGSMSLCATKSLWLLAKYFSPRTIVEIGTYIGRSTSALYLGSRPEIEKLYTCDASFDAWRAGHLSDKGDIQYFGKTTSTQMLETLRRDGVVVDLFFIDGRLQEQDIPLIRAVSHEKTVFILDDFEGLEKGVANGLALKGAFASLLLLSPPHGDLVRRFSSSHNLALLVPKSAINITPQVPLPLTML